MMAGNSSSLMIWIIDPETAFICLSECRKVKAKASWPIWEDVTRPLNHHPAEALDLEGYGSERRELDG